MSSQDTIVALATPKGRGGVAVLRISGSLVKPVALKILGAVPKPRQATYAAFQDATGECIDKGIALLYPSPHSFTGEDVLELQGHGGPVIIDRLLSTLLSFGVRQALPGEFSKRAFLNDKIDLAQAEAIADLINSASVQAARSAIRSLQGEFSQAITSIVEQLIHTRVYVEAAIDFPEEEIDFFEDGQIAGQVENILQNLLRIKEKAKQGSLLREGITVVIAGLPNAGKSTLLNALAGREVSIVTDIPGTTRDILREHLLIEGVPVSIVDTAGLRDQTTWEQIDRVEQEGVRRALQEIEKADAILWVVDGTTITPESLETIRAEWKEMASLNKVPFLTLINKTDLMDETSVSCFLFREDDSILAMSAKEGVGLEALRNTLLRLMGHSGASEDAYMARSRHLSAIDLAIEAIKIGLAQISVHKAGELLAEDLRKAQVILGEITGKFSSDDLLGRIFSSFCIGK